MVFWMSIYMKLYCHYSFWKKGGNNLYVLLTVRDLNLVNKYCTVLYFRLAQDAVLKEYGVDPVILIQSNLDYLDSSGLR